MVTAVISVCGDLLPFSNTKTHFNLHKHIAVHCYKDIGSGFIFYVPVSAFSIRTCKHRAQAIEHSLVSEEDGVIFETILKTILSIRPANRDTCIVGKITLTFPLHALKWQIKLYCLKARLFLQSAFKKETIHSDREVK